MCNMDMDMNMNMVIVIILSFFLASEQITQISLVSVT